MSDLYVIKKYVVAESAEDAIKKEKKYPVSDVWLDEDWKIEKIKNTDIGFKN